MTIMNDNQWPDSRHDKGWKKPKKWVPPDFGAEQEAYSPLFSIVDNLSYAIMRHDLESLTRERDLLIDILKTELELNDVIFERDGRVTLMHPEGWSEDDDDDTLIG